MEEEVWKDIPEYEGKYQVSNQGRVRSLDRYVHHGNHRMFLRGVVLNNAPCSNGYIKIMLCNKGITVHRLVALAFVENKNPTVDIIINHKNENRIDNRAENLEWCTYRYNLTYGTAPQRCKASRQLKRCKYTDRPIQKYTKEGVFVCEYESRIKAAEECGLMKSRTALSFAAKTGNTLVGGFLWKDSTEKRVVKKYENKNIKPVCMMDMDGNVLNIYKSMTEASDKSRISKTMICACCRGRRGKVHGTKWRYASKEETFRHFGV